MLKRFGLILIFTAFLSVSSRAQSDLRKTEIGVVVTTINLNKSVGEKPLGIGGRFTYNLNDYVAVDSEAVYYPENPSNNFGQTEVLAGVKAGYRTEKIGVFAKARPGVVRFGGDSFRVYNGGAKNYFAMDVGGVLEIYPNSRTIIRIDVGDTIIPFGNDQIKGGLGARTPGTTHSVQTSVGFGFRF